MKKSCLALSLFLAALSAHAQDRLGLLEVYQLAMENDPLIREAEANLLANSEVKAQARSSLLPSMSLSGTQSDGTSNSDRPTDFVTGTPVPGVLGTQSDFERTNLSISLNQTVFNWGQFLQMKQADKVIMRAETDYASAQQDLMVRVAGAYFNVLAAQDQLASDIAAREALSQQLEQTQRRFEVGLIAITNVQEAQAGYDSAFAAVIASERVLATAFETLREIISVYVTDLQSPIENLPLVTPDPNDVDTWVQTAEAQNLALVASRISADIAQDDIDITRSQRFPTLSLSAAANDQSSTTTTITDTVPPAFPPPGNGLPIPSGSDGNSISLNLSMPIFTGGATRSRIRQNVYRHRAALETVERVMRQTERLTRDAYLGVTSEISRVEALRQALESARTALLATQAGEEVGQRTGVDVVNAQNNVRRQETTYAASRYEYLLNILRLKQAAGTLTEMDLAEIDTWLE